MFSLKIKFSLEFEKLAETTKVAEHWDLKVETVEDLLSELYLYCEPF